MGLDLSIEHKWPTDPSFSPEGIDVLTMQECAAGRGNLTEDVARHGGIGKYEHALGSLY